MSAEARIKALGLTLPEPARPVGNYVPGARVGNLLFLSGHGPVRTAGQPSARGKVGRDLSTEEAYKVAREVGLNLLGSARTILGRSASAASSRNRPSSSTIRHSRTSNSR